MKLPVSPDPSLLSPLILMTLLRIEAAGGSGCTQLCHKHRTPGNDGPYDLRCRDVSNDNSQQVQCGLTCGFCEDQCSAKGSNAALFPEHNVISCPGRRSSNNNNDDDEDSNEDQEANTISKIFVIGGVVLVLVVLCVVAVGCALCCARSRNKNQMMMQPGEGNYYNNNMSGGMMMMPPGGEQNMQYSSQYQYPVSAPSSYEGAAVSTSEVTVKPVVESENQT